VTELAQEATLASVLEREPPEVMERNLRIATRLWSSATAFCFFAFLFAYFYLRSLNQQQLWHPKHVDPSVALGTLAAAAVAVAAVLLLHAARAALAGRLETWRLDVAVALVLVGAAIGFQIAGWSSQDFGPTDGGFASVYIGWTSFEVLFLAGLFYWVETTLAASFRRPPATTTPDIDRPATLVPAQLEAVSFFAAVLAAIVVVSWIVLYLL
jgi:heme/copper-type cytochrome/quinol oxidase subunit 3